MTNSDDETMTDDNQRRASPELEAAANKAAHSAVSNQALAEFATHPGLIGLLARELQSLRSQRREGFVLVPQSTVKELLSVKPDKCPAKAREALYELASLPAVPDGQESQP